MSVDNIREAVSLIGQRVYVSGEDDYGTVWSVDANSIYVKMESDSVSVSAAYQQVSSLNQEL